MEVILTILCRGYFIMVSNKQHATCSWNKALAIPCNILLCENLSIQSSVGVSFSLLQRRRWMWYDCIVGLYLFNWITGKLIMAPQKRERIMWRWIVYWGTVWSYLLLHVRSNDSQTRNGRWKRKLRLVTLFSKSPGACIVHSKYVINPN